MPWEQMRTLLKVKSSAIIPLHPSVPNFIVCSIIVFLGGLTKIFHDARLRVCFMFFLAFQFLSGLNSLTNYITTL